jgi:hypothetical protein
MNSGLFGFGHRFGSVSGFSNLFRRRSLAKNQKSSLHTATSFLSMLQGWNRTEALVNFQSVDGFNSNCTA